MNVKLKQRNLYVILSLLATDNGFFVRSSQKSVLGTIGSFNYKIDYP